MNFTTYACDFLTKMYKKSQYDQVKRVTYVLPIPENKKDFFVNFSFMNILFTHSLYSTLGSIRGLWRPFLIKHSGNIHVTGKNTGTFYI